LQRKSHPCGAKAAFQPTLRIPASPYHLRFQLSNSTIFPCQRLHKTAKIEKTNPMKKSKRFLLTLISLICLANAAQAHYDPKIGGWLARDPMGEGGGLSLYGMIGNDPVNHWDLLGLELGVHPSTSPEFKKHFENAIKRIKENCPEAKKLIEQLEKSKNKHVVNPLLTGPSGTIGDLDDPDSTENAKNGKGSGSTVAWNPRDEEANCPRCPEGNLLHELQHAVDRDSGKLDKSPNPKTGVPNSEEEAVRRENELRRKLGLEERKTYGGKPVENPSGSPKNPIPTPPLPPVPGTSPK